MSNNSLPSFLPNKRNLFIRTFHARFSIPQECIEEVLNDMLNWYEEEIADYLATQLERQGLVRNQEKPGAGTLQQWIQKTLNDWGFKANR